MTGLSLFSGIGGLDLALKPWVTTKLYCDNDSFARNILRARMATGELDDAPIHYDIRTLAPKNKYDIVFGGFPCTDLSDASRGRGKGLDGPQSGLWREMLRIIGITSPPFVFIENVDGSARKKWLPYVRRDLWAKGYTSLPIQVRASDVGAPFAGSRIFVAAADRKSKSAKRLHEKMASVQEPTDASRSHWRKPPSRALGVADGVSDRMDRLKMCGNAVVWPQAREAFKILMGL